MPHAPEAQGGTLRESKREARTARAQHWRATLARNLGPALPRVPQPTTGTELGPNPRVLVSLPAAALPVPRP